MTDSKDEEETGSESQPQAEESKERPHVCSVCAKPSETAICLHCESKIRGEILEHQHEINKAGRTDTGRR